MRKLLLIAAASCALAAPALADEVGVRVAPGVSVGESHRVPDESRKTVIKKDEPGGQTTVIKKEHGDGSESKTVIHRNNY
jgi:hypothetical protein